MPPKTTAGLLLCRIVIICLIGCAGIVAIQGLCPHENNREIITILVGFLSAAIVGLIGLAKSQQNAYMIKEHADQVAAKIDQLTNTAAQTATKLDAQVVAAKLDELRTTTAQIATKAEDATIAAKLVQGKDRY